jgi:DNA adenine methylase
MRLPRTASSLPLFTIQEPIVNVASVPQRSPFRYAGGKTWLIPQIRRWLASLPSRPSEFIEAFAGGASVGLTVGIEARAEHVTLIELDRDVSVVWEAIFGGRSEALCDRLLTFKMTRDSARDIIESKPRSIVDRAFRTLVRNRVLHGGILAPGASMMNEGENGRGVLSRWYPATLANRIRSLALHRSRFAALPLDGVGVIRSNANRSDTAFFVDPPYTVAGRRLYTCHQIDHEELFDACSRVQGAVLLTYDNTPQVRAWAAKYGFDTALVPMKSRQHTVKLELLIGKDLAWVRGLSSAAVL